MSKKTIEERLNERIEELESERDELEEKIDELTCKLEPDAWQWRQMRKLTKEENLGLPLPRLEMRYRDLNEFEVVIDYGLVYEHLLGDIIFCPIGSTKTSGGSVRKETHLDTPFRDGAHILNEMYQLKLPGYVVHGTNTRQLTLDPDELPTALRRKMEKR